jgi:hypothetical protein
MVNCDQFCVRKLGRGDERVDGEDCRCPANIELLIAFVVLDLTRSSVAATWFCSAATLEISPFQSKSPLGGEQTAQAWEMAWLRQPTNVVSRTFRSDPSVLFPSQ